MTTDTAHLAWNDRWSNAEGRHDWLTPEQDVVACAQRLLQAQGSVRALYLGCGVGRHSLEFARMGLDVSAVDMAGAGLDELRRVATHATLDVKTYHAPMTQLPFPDAHFDYVLAFNVIYHGDETVVRETIAEIKRVLRPGGVYQGTMLSKRNANYGQGTEIAPSTFVKADDDDDKVHPHLYCDAKELVEFFDGFELLSLEDRVHSVPGSWHWHMIAERRL
ncbi:SAM-dependent methyltransferase [Rhodoligotrophos appendicifer]|uniref:class I SAM-dependent methyltransferase n=1 Tax=Rhodoligotrophos appendicifer TaxID=987056 RepID=UPI00117D74B2|nr:class I SAM-dependent methyltransferase [Rhodoligotrophos appendicifer]